MGQPGEPGMGAPIVCQDDVGFLVLQSGKK
jgi:hypothetical protein